MTSIIGILCKGGVVVGTDSSTTFVHGERFPTIEQPTRKITIIGDQVIVACTGAVGQGQRFCAVANHVWSNNDFLSAPAITIVKALSRAMLEDLQHTYCKPGLCGALVGFPSNEGYQLCEFGIRDFQPELKTERIWYCSMGSAQPITDTFLGFIRDVYWKEGQPNLHEGVFAVVWTLELAVEINPGGVKGPIHIAVLEQVDKGKMRARIVDNEDLDEQRQATEEAKKELVKLRERLQDIEAPDIPDIPRP